PAAQRGAPGILPHDWRPKAPALQELGRLRAIPEAPGIAHQLHRRLRYASDDQRQRSRRYPGDCGRRAHHRGQARRGRADRARLHAAARARAAATGLGGASAPADSADFLNSTGTWASNPGTDGVLGTPDDVTTTGLDNVDLWVGGLAEEVEPFGGLLGSTFNFVFETQLEKLQNGDRFYYLSRTAGLSFGFELDRNSFAQMVMLNTDATHLPEKIFTTPTYILEVDQTKQFNANVIPGPDGILGTADDLPGNADPTGGIVVNGVEIAPLVSRD